MTPILVSLDEGVWDLLGRDRRVLRDLLYHGLIVHPPGFESLNQNTGVTVRIDVDFFFRKELLNFAREINVEPSEAAGKIITNSLLSLVYREKGIQFKLS
ncbi:MAG: hypothetical protein H7A24_01730 [Leptospiraceae bacterium]|nr:hypothetical protein [Leptospiraceae bacterium]MCP5510573.1 hypothetical protein [Leptospiraceae bacterium]